MWVAPGDNAAIDRRRLDCVLADTVRGEASDLRSMLFRPQVCAPLSAGLANETLPRAQSRGAGF